MLIHDSPVSEHAQSVVYLVIHILLRGWHGRSATKEKNTRLNDTITKNGLVPLNANRTHLTGLLSNKANLHGDKVKK